MKAAFLGLSLTGCARALVPNSRPAFARAVATQAAAVAAPPVADVTLAECPLTQWGEPLTDVVAEQRAARAKTVAPFVYELPVPAGLAGDDAAQEAWLLANAAELESKLNSHGAVHLKGWSLITDSTGFRRAYEALGLNPCLDPLHAVSARPMVDKGSAVYEAVNKESRANFFIGMHNEFVGKRAPRAAMFVCFKAAEEGGEFLVADGRRVFRDLEEGLLTKLYGKSIRYSVMELPFFSWIDGMPDVAREPVQGVVRAVVSAAINAKVDFDVQMQWQRGGAYDASELALQARAPSQPPIVRHPKTGEPTWFCNVHSHSSFLRKQREGTYGAERFEGGASQINKSDMYFGDDEVIADADFVALDELTKKHTQYIAMQPGDAVLVDNYQTMHGRNVFQGTRKHAVTWFE